MTVETDDVDVPHPQDIIPRRDKRAGAGVYPAVRAILADDFQPPLDDVPYVPNLAPIRLRDRLGILRPLPTRIMTGANDRHTVHVHDLQFALADWARFVGRVKSLLVNGCLLLGCPCICHKDLLVRRFVSDRPELITSMRVTILALDELLREAFQHTQSSSVVLYEYASSYLNDHYSHMRTCRL